MCFCPTEFWVGWLALGLVIFLPPVIRGVRRMKYQERVRQGLCGRCGYDVRASRVRCPECGALLPYRGPRPHG